MRYNAEEQAELVRQHSRIGRQEHEAWPSVTLRPAEFLFLLRTVPDDAGPAGVFEALRHLPPRPWYRRWL